MLFFLIVGCERVSPDAKSDLATLRHALRDHVEYLRTSPTISDQVDSFVPVLDCWNEIKEKHHYPKSIEKQMTSGLNFIRFVLVNAESFEDMGGKDLSFEEEKARTEFWMSKGKNAYDQIDHGYWKILESTHAERGGTDNEIKYIRLLRKEMVCRGVPDLMTGTRILGSVYELLFKECSEVLEDQGTP